MWLKYIAWKMLIKIECNIRSFIAKSGRCDWASVKYAKMPAMIMANCMEKSAIGLHLHRVIDKGIKLGRAEITSSRKNAMIGCLEESSAL